MVSKRLGGFIITVVVGFALFFMTGLQLRAITTPLPTTDVTLISPTASSTLSNYDPAYYGLPSTIAGYRIILVETSENIACMPKGTINLVLRSKSPSVDALLKQSSDGDVMSELKKLDIHPTDWGIQYVGPGVSDEDVWQNVHQWDPKIMKGCVNLGRTR